MIVGLVFVSKSLLNMRKMSERETITNEYMKDREKAHRSRGGIADQMSTFCKNTTRPGIMADRFSSNVNTV